MDQAVMQLFAERLGFTKEECDALRAGDVSSLISNRSSHISNRSLDPLLLALVSSGLRQNTAQNEVTENQTDYERVLTRAKQVIRKLKEDLAAADTMMSYIAGVFGACSVCWGQNKLCSRCKGSGKPGSTQPVEEELMAWVVPALKKLGMRVVKVEQQQS